MTRRLESTDAEVKTGRDSDTGVQIIPAFLSRGRSIVRCGRTESSADKLGEGSHWPKFDREGFSRASRRGWISTLVHLKIYGLAGYFRHPFKAAEAHVSFVLGLYILKGDLNVSGKCVVSVVTRSQCRCNPYGHRISLQYNSWLAYMSPRAGV